MPRAKTQYRNVAVEDKFYVTLEVRLVVEARNKDEASRRAGGAVYAMEDHAEITVKGRDVVACTEHHTKDF